MPDMLRPLSVLFEAALGRLVSMCLESESLMEHVDGRNEAPAEVIR
jgi:hypothetical protein